MSTDETVQFKMYLPKELDERLKTLAKKFGKKSGQDVVLELINVYLPVWVSVNDSTDRAISRQLKIVTDEKNEMTREEIQKQLFPNKANVIEMENPKSKTAEKPSSTVTILGKLESKKRKTG